ncbi:hypothetical protein HDU99_006922 [Rhizoclosmatium hyalinum]|nr:hypothetical protein HDU99_006922 [Rhizoclosmatium hyalinum]
MRQVHIVFSGRDSGTDSDIEAVSETSAFHDAAFVLGCVLVRGRSFAAPLLTALATKTHVVHVVAPLFIDWFCASTSLTVCLAAAVALSEILASSHSRVALTPQTAHAIVDKSQWCAQQGLLEPTNIFADLHAGGAFDVVAADVRNSQIRARFEAVTSLRDGLKSNPVLSSNSLIDPSDLEDLKRELLQYSQDFESTLKPSQSALADSQPSIEMLLRGIGRFSSARGMLDIDPSPETTAQIIEDELARYYRVRIKL